MNIFLLIIIIFVIAAALVAALVFATKGASDITKISIPGKKWHDNPHLHDAHTMLTWLVVICWIAIPLLILLVILLIFGGLLSSATKKGGKHMMLILALLGVSGLSLAIGIVAIFAAENMRQAPADTTAGFDSTDPNYLKAYHDTIISAAVGIGAVGMVVLLGILIAVARHAAVSSRGKKEEEEEIQKQREVEGLNDIKRKSALAEIQAKEAAENEGATAPNISGEAGERAAEATEGLKNANVKGSLGGSQEIEKAARPGAAADFEFPGLNEEPSGLFSSAVSSLEREGIE